ncbi:hypothetical protein ACLMJK_008231 [Lecanora helva]
MKRDFTAPDDYFSQLPSELADAVCKFLKLRDIASLRLVSGYCHDAATPYLVPTVHLLFNDSDMRRLRAISEHPVISQHVTGLYYEPDILIYYKCYSDWERYIEDDDYEGDMPFAPPPEQSTARDLRIYHRERKKWEQRPRHHFKRTFLNDAYEKHIKIAFEQRALRGLSYGASFLVEAMRRLPKLTSVRICPANHIDNASNRLKEAYGPTLVKQLRTNDGTTYAVLEAAWSLLVGANRGDRELDALQIQDVDWKFLLAPEKYWNRIKLSFRHLTSLDLILNSYFFDVDKCREKIESGLLHELLCSAPNLRELMLKFEPMIDEYNAYLPHVFRNSTWTSLQRLGIEFVATSAQGWLDFLTRHSSTMRCICIRTMELTTGTWLDILETMQKILNLDLAYFLGELIGFDLEELWDLEPDTDQDGNQDQDPRSPASIAISDYLIRGGICPLRELDKYFPSES